MQWVSQAQSWPLGLGNKLIGRCAIFHQACASGPNTSDGNDNKFTPRTYEQMLCQDVWAAYNATVRVLMLPSPRDGASVLCLHRPTAITSVMSIELGCDEFMSGPTLFKHKLERPLSNPNKQACPIGFSKLVTASRCSRSVLKKANTIGESNRMPSTCHNMSISMKSFNGIPIL